MANAAVSVLLTSIDSFHYSIRIFSLQCLIKKKKKIRSHFVYFGECEAARLKSEAKISSRVPGTE